MHSIAFFLCFIFFLCSLPLSGNALTMEEAVKLALENNYRIKEQQSLCEAQKYRTASEKEVFKPDLDLGYSFTWQDNVYSSFQTKEASFFTVEAKYNLFKGFIDTSSVKEAEALVDAYFYKKKSVEADVILDVKFAFIEFLRSRKNMEVARETVELLERQKKDIELFHEQGIVTKSEVLKMEVALASAKQDFLQSESDMRISLKKLERIMGLNVKQHEEISEIVLVDDEEVPYEDLSKEMLKNRSELKYLKAVIQSIEFSKKVIKGKYLPTVDLSLKYSLLGDSVTPTGRDEKYDNETKAMIMAKWKLMDIVKKRHDVCVEDAEIRAKEAKIADLIDELKLQLKSVIEEHRLSVGRLKVASKAVQQADENYRITNDQFHQQMATITDLLDARLLLTTAKNDCNNINFDLHESIVKTERIIENYNLN